MKCKICHQNETNSTSGICWECCSKRYVIRIIKHKKGVLSGKEGRTCPNWLLKLLNNIGSNYTSTLTN